MSKRRACCSPTDLRSELSGALEDENPGGAAAFREAGCRRRLTVSAARRGLVVGLVALCAALVGALPAAAQFGKNKIQYRQFDWKIYHSPHFDVYYYTEEEPLLQKVVSFAESAYDRLSREFDYQIKDPTPLIFYATHSAFEQNNIILNFIPEGIGAFASPVRNRMVLPVDLPDPELLQLISHELTHVFQYHVLFEGKLSRSFRTGPPQWLMEGMASYVAKDESARDRMFLRDAVVNDLIPPITRANVSGFFAYRFGHAVFDFIEDRFGKDGFRDFVYEYRNTLGDRVDRAVERAFRLTGEDFDLEFRRWLRRRYLPELVRTGEPADFGKPFRPIEERGEQQDISPAASPSGDLVAAFTTQKDDVDVVLFDAKKRVQLRNLTKGFSNQYQYLVAQELVLGRKMGRDLSFSPDGNTLALFAKRERGRSLVLVDVLRGGVRKMIDMDVEQQTAPAWSTDGKTVAFSGNLGGRFDIFTVDVDTNEVKNLTQDAVFDGAPVYSPDGKSIVISSVAGGHAKLFRLDLADPAKRTQLTFGDSDDVDAVFSTNGQRIYFTSDRSGSDNIWGLDLPDGKLSQYTNVVTGTFMPTVLASSEGDRLVYSGYWKGQFELYTLDEITPVSAADAAATSVTEAATKAAAEQAPALPASADTAAPKSAEELPIFEPEITATIDEANKEKYKGFKLFIEDAGAEVGVNSDQSFFSDTYLSMTDYLGNRRMIFRFSSIESFSNFDIAYYSLKGRWNWGARIFDHRTFYIGFEGINNPTGGRVVRGRAAYKETGGLLSYSYPFDFYHRFEVAGGYMRRDVQYQSFAINENGEQVFTVVPRKDTFPYVEVGLVGDTTVFAGWGPVSGRRWRIGGSYAPDTGKDQLALSGDAPGSILSATVDLDFRQYLQLSERSNLAFRLFVGASFGNAPQPFYFGGLDTLRGFDFRDFSGDRAAFANLELRFPLFDFLGNRAFQIRGIRGRIFLDVGGAYYSYSGRDFKFFDSANNRLQDGRAAYGYGVTFDFLGLQLNWDFAKQWKFEGAEPGYQTFFWIGTSF
jgi:Tol biopolymer transport system component